MQIHRKELIVTYRQIQNAAYDLYYVHWVLTHLTRDQILDTIADYHEALMARAFTGTLKDYVNDMGFDGEAPVCKAEFLEAEFKDEDYMRGLLAPYNSGDTSLLSAYERCRKAETRLIPVHARLVRQRWINDYAITESEETFDCTDALDTFGVNELPKHADDLHACGALNFGDDIFHAAVRLGVTDEWDGPFELYIDNDDEYQRYLQDRHQ
jgi:hypothetical protein